MAIEKEKEDSKMEFTIVYSSDHLKKLPQAKKYEWRGVGLRYSCLCMKPDVFNKKSKEDKKVIVKKIETLMDKWSRKEEGWKYTNEGIILKAQWLGYFIKDNKRVYYKAGML